MPLLGSKRFRRQLWSLALVALAVCLFPPGAAAHPMGDFTVSRYSRLVVGADRLTVHYVLDIAEIPTARERAAMDDDGNGQVSQAETDAYAAAERVRQACR